MMRIILTAVVLLGLSSCGDDDSPRTSLNGTWRVVSFADFTTNTVEYKTQENSWGKDIIVTFDDTSNPKLFSGEVTTNSVQGEFDYVNERQFTVARYGTTYVGQPKWADQFAAAILDKNSSYKIYNKSLRIYYKNNSRSVTLVRE